MISIEPVCWAKESEHRRRIFQKNGAVLGGQVSHRFLNERPATLRILLQPAFRNAADFVQGFNGTGARGTGRCWVTRAMPRRAGSKSGLIRRASWNSAAASY